MGTGRKSIWSILSRPTWFFITEPWHFKNSVHTLSQCTRSQGFSCPRVKSGQRMLLHAHPLWIHHHVIMQVLWMTLPENPSSGVFKTPRGDELTLEYSCFACSTREVPLSVL